MLLEIRGSGQQMGPPGLDPRRAHYWCGLEYWAPLKPLQRHEWSKTCRLGVDCKLGRQNSRPMGTVLLALELKAALQQRRVQGRNFPLTSCRIPGKQALKSFAAHQDAADHSRFSRQLESAANLIADP